VSPAPGSTARAQARQTERFEACEQERAGETSAEHRLTAPRKPRTGKPTPEASTGKPTPEASNGKPASGSQDRQAPSETASAFRAYCRAPQSPPLTPPSKSPLCASAAVAGTIDRRN